MNRDDKMGSADTDHNHQQDEVRVSLSPEAGEGGALSPSIEDGAATGDALGPEQMEPFNNNIPVFLDRTFRMIENISNDIVCWSEAGDSFIIKQVLVFEGLLPSYYNHKKFLSFVRQLNFYGFKKVKGGASSRARAASSNGTQGAEAGLGAATRESDSWEEFRHPQFRRGRRDLLVGIKRQKDGGRLKRKRGGIANGRTSDDTLEDVFGQIVTARRSHE
ncbi:unnamed protein product [Scytosiphon promiscuus]